VFEGIFALVPLILIALVSIFLRVRADRRRRRLPEEEGKSEQKQEGGERQIPAASPMTRERGAGASAPGKPAPQPLKARPPRQANVPYRQEYAYPQPLPVAMPKGPEETYTPPYPEAEGGRLRFGTPGMDISQPPVRQRRKRLSEGQFSRLSAKSVKVEKQRVSSLPQRLEKLPPLQRAVVWAEILGPPGGQHRDVFP
jgi:hypothetical protein